MLPMQIVFLKALSQLLNSKHKITQMIRFISSIRNILCATNENISKISWSLFKGVHDSLLNERVNTND